MPVLNPKVVVNSVMMLMCKLEQLL